jgi:hypothetical protein
MEKIKAKFGFSNLFVMDSIGKSGGLASLWNDEAGFEIQNYSRCHINAIIKVRGMVDCWKFTVFYGHPDASKCHEAWSLLQHVANLEPLPWLCLGDFNEILDNEEKCGGGQ